MVRIKKLALIVTKPLLHSCIAMRRWVRREDGLLIKVLLRNDRLDDMLFEINRNLIISDSLIMLVLPSGLSHEQVSFFLTSVRRALSLMTLNILAHIIKNKSNGAACVTDNLLIVYISLGGNLSKDHNHVSLGACFTCNLAIRVLSEASIKHCIGDLVTQLVEMTLIYKLRSEYEGLHSFNPVSSSNNPPPGQEHPMLSQMMIHRPRHSTSRCIGAEKYGEGNC
ncbi:unnamed protein product, partial [Vitis vinifera]